MTKCIVLPNVKGGAEKKEKKKPIEFDSVLGGDGNMTDLINPDAGVWKYIELISKSYTKDKRDLMYAYDSDRNDGVLYLGYWNDGVVE